MKHRLLACLLPIALLVAPAMGCGGGDGKAHDTNQREAVAGVVARLQAATREKDAGAICRDIYAHETVRSLERKPGGCEGRVRRAFAGDAEHVTAKASNVKVDGDRASAQVESRTPSGKRASDTFRFSREAGVWRIVVSE